MPFVAFIALLIAGQLIAEPGGTSWVFRAPQYWVKPAQTLVCGALLCFYWRDHNFAGVNSKRGSWLLVVAVGIAAFFL